MKIFILQLILCTFSFNNIFSQEQKKALQFYLKSDEVAEYVGSQYFKETQTLTVQRQTMDLCAGLEPGEVLAPYPESSDPYCVPAAITVVTQVHSHLQNSCKITGKAADCFLILQNGMQEYNEEGGLVILYYQEALEYMGKGFEDIKANLECALGFINYWVDNSVCTKTEKSMKLLQLVDEQKHALRAIQTLTEQDCMFHRDYLARMYTVFLKKNREAVKYVKEYDDECKSYAKGRRE